MYDFAVYGFFVPTISALFFPASDALDRDLDLRRVRHRLPQAAPGSIVFGVYGHRVGRRNALVRLQRRRSPGAVDAGRRFQRHGDEPALYAEDGARDRWQGAVSWATMGKAQAQRATPAAAQKGAR
jgi:hypothetical protein